MQVMTSMIAAAIKYRSAPATSGCISASTGLATLKLAPHKIAASATRM
jgi:hypothetical protein